MSALDKACADLLEKALEYLLAALEASRAPWPAVPVPPETLQVGNFNLKVLSHEKISIYATSGEGGTFDLDAFVDVVAKFYSENF
jgi:hypothetical protein